MATSWSVLGLELTPAAGGSIGSRASRLVGSGALTGGLAGNLAGRGLCEREERGAKDRGQRSRRRQIGREGRELVNNRRARRKLLRKEAGGCTIRAPFASDRAGTHWQRPRTSWRGTCRPFCVWLLRCVQLVSCAIMPRARTRSAVKNTPHGGSQLDVSIGRAPSQPIRSRSSGGQDIDFWHLCG